MKPLRIIAVLLFGTFMVGCGVVITPVPFGLKPVHLDPEYFNGTWETDDEDDTLEITVLDEANAVLELSFGEGGDPDSSAPRKVKAHLLVGKKWQYVSVPAADDGSDSDGYVFACIHATPKRIIIWAPNVERFKQLIDAGKLSGKVEKDTVTLGKITPEMIEIIESEHNGFVFEWKEPVILTKRKSPVAESKKAD